jgi:hypothetical protein
MQATLAILARSSSINLVPSPTAPSHIDPTHHRRRVALNPETNAVLGRRRAWDSLAEGSASIQ